MRHAVIIMIGALCLVACGGGQPAASPDDELTSAESETGSSEPASEALEAAVAEGGEPAQEPSSSGAGKASDGFVLNDSTTAKDARGASESKIKPSKTEAALKFIVVDKEKGPIPGIVIALSAPDGKCPAAPTAWRPATG
jgi:hypothetical protein